VTSSSSIQDAGHQSYIDIPPDPISLLLMEASSKEEEVLCYIISHENICYRERIIDRCINTIDNISTKAQFYRCLLGCATYFASGLFDGWLSPITGLLIRHPVFTYVFPYLLLS